MSATLQLENFGSSNILKQTSIDQDIAANATAVLVKDVTDLTAGNSIILGQLGSQASELDTITSISGLTLTVPATKYVHKRFEQLTQLYGSQIRIYRANNVDGTQPADGSFTLLTTISIDPDSLTTTYTDASGGSSYWYKFTYYSGSAETSLADSTAQRGGGYGHYCSIDDIRREAGFINNSNIPNSIIDSRRIDAEQEVNAELYGVYTLPFSVPVPYPVSQTARLIAAGLLLKTEYGPMTSGGHGQGDDKLNEGRMLLMRIKSRELTLTDPSGKSLLNQPTVTSWPNDTTDATNSDLTYDEVLSNNADYGPAFRKSQIF